MLTEVRIILFIAGRVDFKAKSTKVKDAYIKETISMKTQSKMRNKM